MLWIAVGGGVLLLLLAGLRAFAGASVAQVRTALLALAAALGLALAVVLLVSGRGTQAVWALLLLGPGLWRWWRGRGAAARFAAPAGSAPGAAPGSANASAAGEAVDTDTLSMRLDPDAGTWSGTVRRGPLAGRDLHGLVLAELLSLRAGCAADDPDSVPLLDAWLDRTHPGWDRPAPGRDAPPAGAGGPMTRAEALAVLGLADGAAPAEVRAAYTRLMRAAHPDAGGSDWIAARLNEARDTLLPG